ncbi:transcriptional repressor general negative regulator of transcription subunit 4 [Coemansia sp. RSA 1807]|nr:transcriptional repressor general negative regulator of transcription subunit 4 [Coemansia sp. RSA 1807]
MSGSETEDWECPLCMEELDIDDRGFFPCECGYQICRFCHNRLSEDYGGRCPACRRLYSEQTPRWNPISPAQVAKIKNEKRTKERERREIESNSRRHLANVRVVQKNLVYVIGLPSNLATEDILRSHDYFGQFGRISKIVINRRQNGSSSHHPTVGVYVTFAVRDDATRAINAVDGSMLESRVLRATFGTTKYCSYYLRNIPCQNPGCMYLHEPGEEADSFTKEDLAANRANLREGRNGPFDHDDDSMSEDEVRSPQPCHAGRAAQGSRPHSTMPAASSQVASGSATSRVRKSSEISSRPRSVDPHNDSQPGSALPATASWASRAVTKKPEVVDPKPRKPDVGSTMTLRMLPASRGKTKATVPVAVASTPVVRERTKSTTQADTATSPNASHHPVLQQMSRERKQQLRHQNRAQQKAEVGAAEPSDKAAAVQTKQGQKAAKKAEAVKVQPAAVAGPSKRSAGTKAKPEAAAVEAIASQLVEAADTADSVDAVDATEEPVMADPLPEVVVEVEQPAQAVQPVQEAQPVEPEASEAQVAASHANGALSFQSITDSLFAQLNAKVSTPSTNSLPAFASTQAIGSHPNRAPGYPISSVDPLLFPSATDAPSIDASSDASRPFDAPAFSLFGQSAQWGEANGTYVQSPLSSLLGESNALGAPIGPLRDVPVGGSGSSSRQRSRWDFAHVDEASAQAELQSVLGRSTGPPIGGTAHQAMLGPAATSFASSRDLGMFSTPVRNSGGYVGGPWGGVPPQQQAPFPPPGFGSRQSSGALHTDSGALGFGGFGAQSAAPASALLSRLMGQHPAPMSDQLHAQSPASMAPMMGTLGSERSRTDPNVLNGLLARLHLNRGDGDFAHTVGPDPVHSGQLSAMSHMPPGMSPVSPVYSGQPQQSPMSVHGPLSAGSSSGFVDPAIVHVGRLNVHSGSVASTGPSSPIGLPPGIITPGTKTPGITSPSVMSPVLGETTLGQTRMQPRSANSSGRSRFLNHFSSEPDGQKQLARADGSARGSGSSSATEPESACMVDGVPPGLPTTGVFGELLQRAKQDAQNSASYGNSAGYGNADGSTFISGRMMLGDIERKLEAARREAQELQAQLSTVIGQNQSAMWALANGSDKEPTSSSASGISFSAVSGM